MQLFEILTVHACFKKTARSCWENASEIHLRRPKNFNVNARKWWSGCQIMWSDFKMFVTDDVNVCLVPCIIEFTSKSLNFIRSYAHLCYIQLYSLFSRKTCKKTFEKLAMSNSVNEMRSPILFIRFFWNSFNGLYKPPSFQIGESFHIILMICWTNWIIGSENDFSCIYQAFEGVSHR